MTESSDTLARQILSGGDTRLRRMAAQGLVPLGPEELIPLQVALTGSSDSEIAAAAEHSLETTDPTTLANFLHDQADPDVLVYFAEKARHAEVLEAILRRRDVPRFILRKLAPVLLEDQQEILLLRQDAIVEDPGILDALETNPKLSGYARRRIREYREHLVPASRPSAEQAAETQEPEAADEEAAEEEATDEEATEEEDAAEEEAADAGEETGVKDASKLSEAQIRSLGVQERLSLARGANRSLRNVLLRDPNPQVAVSVLKLNPVSEQEVEHLCHSRSVCDEVLVEIASRRDWIRKRPIVLALVKNPKTPISIGVKFVPRLSVRELRDLSKNRNVADAVRSTAARLYKIKSR